MAEFLIRGINGIDERETAKRGTISAEQSEAEGVQIEYLPPETRAPANAEGTGRKDWRLYGIVEMDAAEYGKDLDRI